LGICVIIIFKELVLRATVIDEPQLTTGDIGFVSSFVLDLVGALLADGGFFQYPTDALARLEEMYVFVKLHDWSMMEWVS
jgi:hypothetical protein